MPFQSPDEEVGLTRRQRMVAAAAAWVGVKGPKPGGGSCNSTKPYRTYSSDFAKIVKSYMDYLPSARKRWAEDGVARNINIENFYYGNKSWLAWCCIFTVACACKSGNFDYYPFEVACQRAIYQAKDAKKHNVKCKWVPTYGKSNSYIPREGDLILYDWQCVNNWADHIGVVEYTKTENGKTTVHVIEGNSRNVCKRQTRKLNDLTIMGYIVPLFDNDDDPIIPGSGGSNGGENGPALPPSSYTINGESVDGGAFNYLYDYSPREGVVVDLVTPGSYRYSKERERAATNHETDGLVSVTRISPSSDEKYYISSKNGGLATNVNGRTAEWRFGHGFSSNTEANRKDYAKRLCHTLDSPLDEFSLATEQTIGNADHYKPQGKKGNVLFNCVGYVSGRLQEVWGRALSAGFLVNKGDKYYIPLLNDKEINKFVGGGSGNASDWWKNWPDKPGYYKSDREGNVNGEYVGPIPGAVVCWYQKPRTVSPETGSTGTDNGHVGFVEAVYNKGRWDEYCITSEAGANNDGTKLIAWTGYRYKKEGWQYKDQGGKDVLIGFLYSPICELGLGGSGSAIGFSFGGWYNVEPTSEDYNAYQEAIDAMSGHNILSTLTVGSKVRIQGFGYENSDGTGKKINKLGVEGKVKKITTSTYNYGVSIDGKTIIAYYDRQALLSLD